MAAIFLLLPFGGYLATASAGHLPLWRLEAVLRKFSLYNYAVFLCSFLIAFGLLRIKKWAYYLFFVFVGLLISYNLYQSFLVLSGSPGRGPGGRTLTLPEILTNSVLILACSAAIFYFLQKEISAPYLSLIPRGFRRHMRETLPMPVRWETASGAHNGETITENISTTGCLIPVGPTTPLAAGELLTLQLILNYDQSPAIIDVRGEVIRILPPPKDEPDAPGGAGILFLFTAADRAARRKLRAFLAERFAPRYRATNALRWGPTDAPEANQAQLFNISSGGAYIQTTDHLPLAGDRIHFAVEHRAGHISGTGHVRWTNSDALWGKQKGFGIEFDTIGPRLAFWLWLVKLRWSSFRIR